MHSPPFLLCVRARPPAYIPPSDTGHATRPKIAHRTERMSEVVEKFARSRIACGHGMLFVCMSSRSTGHVMRLRKLHHNAHKSAPL